MSTRCGAAACIWPASCRARDSNCSTMRVARSMPAVTRSLARRRAASSGARARLCTCRRKAASGERNSWAASPTKRCNASNAACRRASSRFISCTSGCTSCGRSASGKGERSSARRTASWLRVRCNGARVRVTTHHTTSMMSGASSSTGTMERSATSPAIWRRDAASCATWITCAGVCSA